MTEHHLSISLISKLRDIPLAVVDVETTGASADWGDRVIEIGIVRVEGGRTVAEYQQLVDPQQRISRGITFLTGITPENTVWYYESVLNKMGKNQSDWMRLFMAPGMGHCGGGPGVNSFDSIGALEQWVEKGVAPETMMGIGREMTRPLCQYPMAAEYSGTGDLKDAKNWSCKAPASR